MLFAHLIFVNLLFLSLLVDCCAILNQLIVVGFGKCTGVPLPSVSDNDLFLLK